MDHKISLAIRTYNEQKHLREVLESIKRQNYENYEIIILDSGSTDDTLKIAAEYDVRIEHIPKEDFNYSYASNKLVEYSTGDLVCFLSGHSVPVNNTFLTEINDVFQDMHVGACYGDVIALPDGSWIEKLFHWLGFVKNKIKMDNRGIILEKTIHPGIFSCSNACARRNLLEKHPFAIELGSGGEDVEVAYRIIQDGFAIARMPSLLVMHSHGKKLLPFIKEYLGWNKMWRAAISYIESSENKE